MDDATLLSKDLVADAIEAYDRYKYAYDHDLLIQKGWHRQSRDGRHLACALGVLGGSVDRAEACPAQVMPRWLARAVPRFFDGLPFDAAKAWGLALYAQLARLKGQVPFSVVYDWQTTCVLEFWAGSLKKRRFTAEVLAEKLAAIEKLRALHRKHLEGGAAPKAEWLEALRKAYAYADADAYAYADADAYAYADADAYAYAYADADAYAYAYADADAYAYAYAEPTPKAAGETTGDLAKRRRAENLKLLADGLVAAMSRAPAPEA